jgi:6-pyruvoyltetrahydropterin/6-carboxytetrahydropterin synthase
MTKIGVVVKHEFSAGHRLPATEGRCRRPHGHNYRVFVCVSGESLDANSMIIDFGDLKQRLARWIDDHWEHAFILDSRDEPLRKALATIPESKLFILENAKPTAESLAQTLAAACRGEMHLNVSWVQVWETDRQYAEVRST